MMSEGLFEVSSTQQHRLDEAVCAATFDTAHELLWTGSSGGAVQGYACPSLDRYAEWKAHVQPVLTRGLLVTANGPLSASADALQLHARGGLPIMTYREPAADLRCVEWERIGGSRVLLGHTSGKVAVFDLPTARVLSEESGGQGVEVLRSNGRVVACGGVGGELSLRDVRTMRVESTVEAHLGPVQALDVKGDLLVSCGLTQRSGRIFCDPLIKVFDIRQAVRALTHIPFPPGPSVVRFQPKFSSVLLIASASGAIMLTDVQIGGIAVQSYQVDCDGAALLACDVSSSGELLAFGDSAGFVHLWSSREDAPVSMFSHPLELPSPSPPPPLLPLHEHDSFSQAYRPEATDVALSVLDTNTMLRVGLPPRTIDGSLQEAMSVVDFVGYVQNPQWRRGMSYAAALEATAALRNRRQVCEGDDIKGGAQNGANPSLVGSRGSHNAPKPVLPKGYRRVEIKQSQSAKFEEFDFSYYNRTRFAGLENDFSDSHINALLQVLYFTPELKDMVTGHVCEREFCLTCELGFVLHMLALAERSTCQPTNLIRALRQMPEAAALGLMDDWEGNEGKPLGERIQRLSCFFLEQLHKEVSAEEGPQQSVVDALFGTAVATRTKAGASHVSERLREAERG